MSAKMSGATNRRAEDYAFMKNLRRKLMNNPRYRQQKAGRIVVDFDHSVEDDVVAIEVFDKATALAEEYENRPKEVTPMQPEKNLTKAEKLELAARLAGSAKYFSYEGLKESDRIANREDWEEDVD